MSALLQQTPQPFDGDFDRRAGIDVEAEIARDLIDARRVERHAAGIDGLDHVMRALPFERQAGLRREPIAKPVEQARSPVKSAFYRMPLTIERHSRGGGNP